MNFSHTIDAVKSRFPNAELDTSDSDSGVYSFLNIRLENGNSADIERREPLDKFGFSLIANREVIYGENGDEFFKTEKECSDRVIQLLESGIATKFVKKDK
jgi:hypothetical protein